LILPGARLKEEVVPSPALYLELNVFEAASRRRELADWVDESVRQLVEPAVHNALLKGHAPHKRLPKTDWTAGDSVLHRGAQAEALEGDVVGEDWSEVFWAQLRHDFQDGKLKNLRYEVRFLGEDGYPDFGRGEAYVHAMLPSVEDSSVADVLAVLVSSSIYGDDIPAHQALWVDAFRSSAARFQASTGYLTIDYPSWESPYEQSIGRWWLDGLRECRSRLRGYYWGNLLSRTHIETLGGIDRIRTAAPCHAVTEIDGGLCYLQLTESVDAFSDEALARLKDYFGPLLPPSEDDFEYRGLPLRIV
jgi:hypothetical protein